MAFSLIIQHYYFPFPPGVTRAWLLPSVVLVSIMQQSESAMYDSYMWVMYVYIHPLFFLFPSYLHHHGSEQSSSVLYGKFSLIIYFIYSISSQKDPLA